MSEIYHSARTDFVMYVDDESDQTTRVVWEDGLTMDLSTPEDGIVFTRPGSSVVLDLDPDGMPAFLCSVQGPDFTHDAVSSSLDKANELVGRDGLDYAVRTLNAQNNGDGIRIRPVG